MKFKTIGPFLLLFFFSPSSWAEPVSAQKTAVVVGESALGAIAGSVLVPNLRFVSLVAKRSLPRPREAVASIILSKSASQISVVCGLLGGAIAGLGDEDSQNSSGPLRSVAISASVVSIPYLIWLSATHYQAKRGGLQFLMEAASVLGLCSASAGTGYILSDIVNLSYSKFSKHSISNKSKIEAVKTQGVKPL